MCVLTTTSDFKQCRFTPLQPLNNGPEPLKWPLMEALMGEALIHIPYLILLYHHGCRWLKENAAAHKLWALQGSTPAGGDEATVNPD